MSTTIVAIVGSYRQNGVTERAVEAVLEAARAHGGQTQVFHLRETPLNFCSNCRSCTQEPGEARGKCLQHDGLEEILTAVEAADGLVLASPVNYYNATALFRRFEERLLGYAYWPWGQNGPRLRSKKRPRKAVLVTAAAAPGFLIPWATGTLKALRVAARLLGARPLGELRVGLVAGAPLVALPLRIRNRAARLGVRLAMAPPA